MAGWRLLRSQTAGDISPVSEPTTPTSHLEPPPSRRKRPSAAIRSLFRIRRRPSWHSRFTYRCQATVKSKGIGSQCIAGQFPGQHLPPLLPSSLHHQHLLVALQAPDGGNQRQGRGRPHWSPASDAGPRREESRQACCPTPTEGSVKRSLPPSCAGSPTASARYTIALVTSAGSFERLLLGLGRRTRVSVKTASRIFYYSTVMDADW